MTDWGKGLIIGAAMGSLPSILFFWFMMEQEYMTRDYFRKWQDSMQECNQ